MKRASKHPHIHHLYTWKLFGGKIFALCGLGLMGWNLVAAWPYNSNPNGPSRTINIIYYVYSRPTWVLGNLFLLTGLFTGHCKMITSFFSLSLFRVCAKCLPTASLIVIFLIQLIFCGDSAPLGTFLTFPCALLYGLGFNLCSLILGVIITMILVFPLYRVAH